MFTRKCHSAHFNFNFKVYSVQQLQLGNSESDFLHTGMVTFLFQLIAFPLSVQVVCIFHNGYGSTIYPALEIQTISKLLVFCKLGSNFLDLVWTLD